MEINQTQQLYQNYLPLTRSSRRPVSCQWRMSGPGPGTQSPEPPALRRPRPRPRDSAWCGECGQSGERGYRVLWAINVLCHLLIREDPCLVTNHVSKYPKLTATEKTWWCHLLKPRPPPSTDLRVLISSLSHLITSTSWGSVPGLTMMFLVTGGWILTWRVSWTQWETSDYNLSIRM